MEEYDSFASTTKCLKVDEQLMKTNPEITSVAYTEMYFAMTDYGMEAHISYKTIFPKEGDLITDDGYLIESKYVSVLDQVKDSNFIISNELSDFKNLEKERLAVIDETVRDMILSNASPKQKDQQKDEQKHQGGFNIERINTLFRISEIRESLMNNNSLDNSKKNKF